MKAGVEMIMNGADKYAYLEFINPEKNNFKFYELIRKGKWVIFCYGRIHKSSHTDEIECGDEEEADRV